MKSTTETTECLFAIVGAHQTPLWVGCRRTVEDVAEFIADQESERAEFAAVDVTFDYEYWIVVGAARFKVPALSDELREAFSAAAFLKAGMIVPGRPMILSEGWTAAILDAAFTSGQAGD